MLVPSRIIETLTRNGLPAMIQAFVNRAETIGGASSSALHTPGL